MTSIRNTVSISLIRSSLLCLRGSRTVFNSVFLVFLGILLFLVFIQRCYFFPSSYFKILSRLFQDQVFQCLTLFLILRQIRGKYVTRMFSFLSQNSPFSFSCPVTRAVQSEGHFIVCLPRVMLRFLLVIYLILAYLHCTVYPFQRASRFLLCIKRIPKAIVVIHVRS